MIDEKPDSEGVSALAPFRHGIFRAVWSASLVSNFGGLIQGVGAAWMMTTIATSPYQVALVQASTTLPIMLFALVAGAIADSFNRRKVMLIAQVIAGFQQEVPALQKLKLVFELELRGRGDIQLFRVEVPGPRITRDIASDAKVRLSVPRSHFNELAREGKVRHWREAFQSGTVKATGPAEILKLIQNVVDKQDERTRTRRLSARNQAS